MRPGSTAPQSPVLRLRLSVGLVRLPGRPAYGRLGVPRSRHARGSRCGRGARRDARVGGVGTGAGRIRGVRRGPSRRLSRPTACHPARRGAAVLALRHAALPADRVRGLAPGRGAGARLRGAGSRLSSEVVLEPGCGACLIPPLILQPLVENAVRHGIHSLVGGGVVRVTARCDAGSVYLRVRNPVDADAATRPGTVRARSPLVHPQPRPTGAAGLGDPAQPRRGAQGWDRAAGEPGGLREAERATLTVDAGLATGPPSRPAAPRDPPLIRRDRHRQSAACG